MSVLKSWSRQLIAEMAHYVESQRKLFPPHSNHWVWGEYQAKHWIEAYFIRMGTGTPARYAKVLKEAKQLGLISHDVYCMECMDTGCSCGGIGLSHHGPCCPCAEINPNIPNWQERRK